HCVLAIRDLPSFPTRRSSDLFPYHLTDVQMYGEAWTRGGARLTFTGYTGADIVNFTDTTTIKFPLHFNWNWGNDMAGLRYTAPLDRKSTRLNSSHSQISYAVF